MNEFEQLRCFVAVVEAGSASKAAQSMDVAVSAVSRRLKELEKQLNSQLIQRTTRTMHLTEQGERFYKHSRQILDALESAKEDVTKQAKSLSGKIKIACPVSFGVAHVVPAIANFKLAHPDIEFELDMNDKRLDLVESGLDMAIRIGSLQDSTYKARKLTHFQHVVCASPDLIAKYGLPSKPTDLANFPALCYGNLHAPEVWEFRCSNGSRGNVRVNSTMQISNGDALRECAIAGLGIICEPSFIVNNAITKKLLVPILTDFSWYGMDIYAIYPGTQFVSTRVRKLIDHLAMHFGQKPYWESFLN